MELLGPVTGFPEAMLRADVLLFLGEDKNDVAAALASVGQTWQPEHAYRGVEGMVADGTTIVLGPWGSAAVEAILWELLSPGGVRRIILVGTSGASPCFRGARGTPFLARPAMDLNQAAGVAESKHYLPAWNMDLPAAAAVSNDLFYGISPLAWESRYGAPPEVIAAWERVAAMDTSIDMETAAFYALAKRFGGGGIRYASIRAVANEVEDLESLPAHAQASLVACTRAAWQQFGKVGP